MLIDGSWIDGGSIAIASIAGLHRPVRRKFRDGSWNTTSAEMIRDALSGAAIVPFLLLIGSVLSSDLLREALATNRVYMGIGGVIGVLAIAGDMLAAK